MKPNPEDSYYRVKVQDHRYVLERYHPETQKCLMRRQAQTLPGLEALIALYCRPQKRCYLQVDPSVTDRMRSEKIELERLARSLL